MWAGFCALINSARAKANKPALGFLNPALYPRRATCFRDIKVGSNGVYHSKSGFDLVTGLGSPNLSALVQALLQV